MAGSSEATTCPVRKVPEEFRQGLWPSLVTAAALHTFVPPGTEAMSMDKPFQTVNRRPISATTPTRVTIWKPGVMSPANGATGWLWTGRRRPSSGDGCPPA